MCLSPVITGNTFAHLPRKLTFLSLPAASMVVDDEIRHLPWTLTSLHLQSATELTDACGRSLPPYLKILWLDDNSTVTLKIAKCLDPQRAISVRAKNVRSLNTSQEESFSHSPRRLSVGLSYYFFFLMILILPISLLLAMMVKNHLLRSPRKILLIWAIKNRHHQHMPRASYFA